MSTQKTERLAEQEVANSPDESAVAELPTDEASTPRVLARMPDLGAEQADVQPTPGADADDENAGFLRSQRGIVLMVAIGALLIVGGAAAMFEEDPPETADQQDESPATKALVGNQGDPIDSLTVRASEPNDIPSWPASTVPGDWSLPETRGVGGDGYDGPGYPTKDQTAPPEMALSDTSRAVTSADTAQAKPYASAPFNQDAPVANPVGYFTDVNSGLDTQAYPYAASGAATLPQQDPMRYEGSIQYNTAQYPEAARYAYPSTQPETWVPSSLGSDGVVSTPQAGPLDGVSRRPTEEIYHDYR